MTPPLVSVLIPIYNVESYLSQCLDSVCHQTLKDLEIICINDGSTDSSLAIIKRYQAKDPRIILIDKPNTGYGDSMNQGIKRATAPYLAIVEPDDWIEEAGLQSLYRLAQSTQADVIKCNYFIEQSGNSTPTTNIKVERVIIPSDHAKPELFALPPAIWSALYRRQFLLDHDIKFLPTPGASYQDLGFNFKTLALSERTVLSPKAFLHYRADNPNSSSQSASKQACVVEEYASIADFLHSHNVYDRFAPAMVAAKFRNYYWNWQRLSGPASQTFFQTMQKELQTAASAGLVQRRYFSFKHWLALQLILHYPNLASRLLHKGTNA